MQMSQSDCNVAACRTNTEDIDSYVQACATGSAVWFGVCRGRLAEGVDLPSRCVRVVFLVGIPFPSNKSPIVALKAAFLDKRKANDPTGAGLVNGNSWKNALAAEAIGQCVGRCVRSDTDYGAVILLDSRFGGSVSANEVACRACQWVCMSVRTAEDTALICRWSHQARRIVRHCFHSGWASASTTTNSQNQLM